MSYRIMIVDGIATNRILLRAMLVASYHDVVTCATVTDAAEVCGQMRPDLVMLDICQEPEAALAFCARLATQASGPPIPVIATISGQPYCRHAPDRIAALRAGAADVLDKSTPDTLLQARIRSLIRASIKAAERALAPEDDALPCGMAEAAAGFVGPEPATGTVALLTPLRRAGPAALRMLLERLPQPPRLLDPTSDLSDEALRPVPDLFIIDGASILQREGNAQAGADVFRLVSDLRSRALSRHAAILVILPRDQAEMAALALDLGAADVVDDRIAVEELAHRVRRIILEKRAVDRHRDSLQSRLLAAVTDPLTGLYNRRYAIPRLERMLAAAQTSGQELAVMMMDIDHFKAINDTHGHPVGDQVLVEVARRLRDNLRAMDLIARFGGEEFLVAMPDTTLDQARGAAERLRRLIEDTPFLAASDGVGAGPIDGGIAVTLSIGVAATPLHPAETEAAEDAIGAVCRRADTALYAAKSAGRNTVTVACVAA